MRTELLVLLLIPILAFLEFLINLLGEGIVSSEEELLDAVSVWLVLITALDVATWEVEGQGTVGLCVFLHFSHSFAPSASARGQFFLI